jgi:hypothetical protein
MGSLYSGVFSSGRTVNRFFVCRAGNARHWLLDRNEALLQIASNLTALIRPHERELCTDVERGLLFRAIRE